MRILIKNARIYKPEAAGDTAVLITDGRITALTEHTSGFKPERVIDAAGLRLVPGFIDLHLHGGGGHFVNEGTPESILAIAKTHLTHGTTTLLPTTWTAPLSELEKAIDAVAEAMSSACPFTIAGIFLEGPFLSPAQSGAQAAGALLEASKTDWAELIDRRPGVVRMMGAAPETPGALELADGLSERGIVASVAHSNADCDMMQSALHHGYSDVTHLYSCCSSVTRRRGFRVPGVVETALAMDEWTVQLIADGRHLPPQLIRLVWKAKGTEKIYLVSDALEFAGLKPAPGSIYTHDGQKVICEDGVVKLASREAFAGSMATSDMLLRTAIDAGIPFTDALNMLTVNPAKRIGLDKTKGRVKPGYDADLVLLDEETRPLGVVSRGNIVCWPDGVASR